MWKMEMLREFCQELNFLLAALDRVCTHETCPTMAVKGQEYLCAAHRGGAKPCSAIDYMVHTLESQTTLLNNQGLFPTRTEVAADSAQHFVSVARRLYRIFSHAFFHHPATLMAFEEKTHTAGRFIDFVSHHNLVKPEERLIPGDMGDMGMGGRALGGGGGGGGKG